MAIRIVPQERGIVIQTVHEETVVDGEETVTITEVEEVPVKNHLPHYVAKTTRENVGKLPVEAYTGLTQVALDIIRQTLSPKHYLLHLDAERAKQFHPDRYQPSQVWFY